MKDINYYHEINVPYKTIKDIKTELEKELETFVGTRAELKEKEDSIKELASKLFAEHTRKRRAAQANKILEFKNDLAEENGVADHPKLNKLWDLSWERGHSSGLTEVQMNFEELVELIK